MVYSKYQIIDSRGELRKDSVVSEGNTMNNMFNSKDYHWSLFIGHLVIGKLLSTKEFTLVHLNLIKELRQWLLSMLEKV
jgi:hypothetical protein